MRQLPPPESTTEDAKQAESEEDVVRHAYAARAATGSVSGTGRSQTVS